MAGIEGAAGSRLNARELDKGALDCYPNATIMQPGSHDNAQTMQRVRVGLTGLAAVVLLIGVGSAVFTSASNEEPVTAIGAPKADVVADISSSANAAGEGAAKASEPLAELGVAPSTSNATAAETPPVATVAPPVVVPTPAE